MTTKVLVAFATKSGSTKEVAEAITKTLSTDNLCVDLQPIKKVSDLAGYDAIILGAPLYMFRWHKDAKKFLTRHQKNLVNLPTAVFAMGPIEDKEEQWQGAREQLDKELEKYPWFSPVSIEVFGGFFEASKLTFPYSLIPAMKQLPPTDLRDWEAIRNWTNTLIEKLNLS